MRVEFETSKLVESLVKSYSNIVLVFSNLDNLVSYVIGMMCRGMLSCTIFFLFSSLTDILVLFTISILGSLSLTLTFALRYISELVLDHLSFFYSKLVRQMSISKMRFVEFLL